jgi:hypothetical protein
VYHATLDGDKESTVNHVLFLGREGRTLAKVQCENIHFRWTVPLTNLSHCPGYDVCPLTLRAAEKPKPGPRGEAGGCEIGAVYHHTNRGESPRHVVVEERDKFGLLRISSENGSPTLRVYRSELSFCDGGRCDVVG